MSIDINTKFITLIGTPLDQSFAARMMLQDSMCNTFTQKQTMSMTIIEYDDSFFDEILALPAVQAVCDDIIINQIDGLGTLLVSELSK